MIIVSKVTRSTAEVVGFLDKRIIFKRVDSPLSTDCFTDYDQLRSEIERVFSNDQITASQWTPSFIRIVLPDERSVKDAIWFDFDLIEESDLDRESKDEINTMTMDRIKILRAEVEILTSRVKPQATGHLHTAIGVINGRIDELVETLV